VTDLNDVTERGQLFNRVYGDLDAHAGLLDVLANGIHAASEDGHHVESDDDRRADIDNGLRRAFEEMDSDDPDPDEVAKWVRHAERSAAEFYRGLDPGVRAYDLPDHVDSGVHHTLGSFAEYVHKSVRRTLDYAERWAGAAE